MLKSLFQHRLLLVLAGVAIFLKLFSLQTHWVEVIYTNGVYPFIARFFRTLLGWIPFSVGDLLYLAAGVFLLVKCVKLIHSVARRRSREIIHLRTLRKILQVALLVYIAFNLLWGLNYNRQGIASQMKLTVAPYSKTDLRDIATVLQIKLNENALLIDSTHRVRSNGMAHILAQAKADYALARVRFPFLNYRAASVKPSMFSAFGHYFGFSGYINPFTGEAQLNTTEPVFVKPFVINHEIAHQLGYGKENEASFVSWMVCRHSVDPEVRYSVYYELFFDAVAECRLNGDTTVAPQLLRGLTMRVKTDKRDEIAFRQKRKNRLQPFVTDFYGRYLQLNNQPNGIATYNEVIAWLVAYMKQYGAEKI